MATFTKLITDAVIADPVLKAHFAERILFFMRQKKLEEWFLMFAHNIVHGLEQHPSASDFLEWQTNNQVSMLAVRDEVRDGVFTDRVHDVFRFMQFDNYRSYAIVLQLGVAANPSDFHPTSVELANQLCRAKALTSRQVFKQLQHMADPVILLMPLPTGGWQMVTPHVVDPETMVLMSSSCVMTSAEATTLLENLKCKHHCLFEKFV